MYIVDGRDLLKPVVLTWISVGLRFGVTQDASYGFTCLGFDTVRKVYANVL
jgi:hypothetical protein